MTISLLLKFPELTHGVTQFLLLYIKCVTTFKVLIWLKTTIFKLTPKRSFGYYEMFLKDRFKLKRTENGYFRLILQIDIRNAVLTRIRCLTNLKRLIWAKTYATSLLLLGTSNWLGNAVLATTKCITTWKELVWAETDWGWGFSFASYVWLRKAVLALTICLTTLRRLIWVKMLFWRKAKESHHFCLIPWIDSETSSWLQ